MLSAYVEGVRRSCQNSSNLAVVYLSVDGDAATFRAMARRLGPPPTPTKAAKEEPKEGAQPEKDQDEEEQDGAWLAVPFCEEGVRDELLAAYVTGDVPAAIVLGPNGEVGVCGWVSARAREEKKRRA